MPQNFCNRARKLRHQKSKQSSIAVLEMAKLFPLARKLISRSESKCFVFCLVWERKHDWRWCIVLLESPFDILQRSLAKTPKFIYENVEQRLGRWWCRKISCFMHEKPSASSSDHVETFKRHNKHNWNARLNKYSEQRRKNVLKIFHGCLRDEQINNFVYWKIKLSLSWFIKLRVPFENWKIFKYFFM